MQFRAPIRTTVAVAATALAMTLLPAVSASSATAPSAPVTVAAPTCTHGVAYTSDGIRTWRYTFVRHYTIPVGTHYHVYNVHLRTNGPWIYQGQQSWAC